MTEGEFDGVIFDCDGTLANTMPLHFQAWQRCLEGTGVDFPEDLFYHLGGVPSPDLVRTLNERSSAHLDPEATAARKEAIYLELLPQAQPIEPVVQLVRQYAGRYPMAVASGGIRVVVERTLDTLGIRGCFQVIASCEDVSQGKPAPDLFQFAARGLGVRPERCIVYEDSPMGMEAARHAGMRAIDVRGLLEHASHV